MVVSGWDDLDATVEITGDDPNTPPGVQLVRALRRVGVGQTLSLVTADARASAELTSTIRSTGQQLLRTVPGAGYVRFVVRRRR
jgi:TusA-related sulfurtransferase